MLSMLCCCDIISVAGNSIIALLNFEKSVSDEARIPHMYKTQVACSWHSTSMSEISGVCQGHTRGTKYH
jgi:hypothetical protein